jgi:2-keto-4-pentenoate hydratase/2-oxohepta-3-ene-1,7-dioic acid hydratase in catechol pathway
MRLIRFISSGKHYYGTFIEGNWAHPLLNDLLDDKLQVDHHRTLKIDRLLAPIVPTDILCIGLNYREHAKETGSPIPVNPMLFIKASGTLNNPGELIVTPAISAQVDYEAELAVVIQKDAKNVSREAALDYVLGYTCANDVSVRDWQKEESLGGGQFARGKSFDTHCPLGPWIVTKDEIENPNALQIKGYLNDQIMQDCSTSDMIFDVPTLIENLSRTMTLRAGAVLLTGTPHGVGVARNPQVWLKNGDRFVVEIEKIGRLENPVVGEK